MNWKKTLLVCVIVLVVAVGAIVLIFSTEPNAERSGATRKSAMLVDVKVAQRGDFDPVIEVMGTVVAEREINLSPRVGGEIVAVSDNFTPGGFVSAGELLVEIDPADYEAVLLERRSALQQAEARLVMEKGRQDVAKTDYEMLEGNLTANQKALVLREPQLNSAMAEVDSARASLRRAELDLERAKVHSPFDAQVIRREANLGSLIRAGDSAGQLIGVEKYWVEAAVPVSKLKWVSFPGEGQTASMARVRNRTDPQGEYRRGEVHRLIGALDSTTRLARVLVSVEDPLTRLPENAGKPKLMIGSYVETQIYGETLVGVVRLERDLLRKEDTVWVKDSGKLRIRKVEIIFSDQSFAYVSGGLEAGDQIVTTDLSTVVDGADLRVEGDSE